MKPHFQVSPGSSQPSGSDVQTLTARKVVSAGAVISASTPRVMVGQEAGPCRQSQISVHKQGDEITSIDVICSCGERISIELLH